MVAAHLAQAKIALLRQAVAAEPQSPKLLYDLAKALADAGDHRASADAFRRAYVLQPTPPTFGRATAEAHGSDVSSIRDRAEALLRNGAVYSSVIAELALSEAQLGNVSEVRRLVDFDRFFRAYLVDAPSGYDRNRFNRELASQIKSDLKFYDSPEDWAIRRGWRNDRVLTSHLPAWRAWVRMIRREVDRYIAGLPRDADHPFLASRPADYAIGAWAVVSNGESFHRPHVHPEAWVSGVYYVTRPAVSLEPDGRVGWLRVGPPEDLGVTAAHGWAERYVEPEPGNLVLMPGYFFHGTRPMNVDQERICVAFDIKPIELASSSVWSPRRRPDAT
jgi:hypothetical protein